MDYFNFLEALVRVSRAYHFIPEMEAILTMPQEKLNFLLKKMDDKFKPLKKTFGAARDKLEAEVGYQPRVVVDEEEEELSEEDDDMWALF